MFFSQRRLARQYLSQGPLNAIDRFGDHTIKLLIVDCVNGKGDGSQSVSDVMIHFGNYLHPGHS